MEEEIDDSELTGEMPAVTPPQPRTPAAPAPAPSETSPAGESPAVVTGEIAVVGGWDMVPTTLPTYVNKTAAQRRTVSTIDLDSTGVWSSGRNDEDSALARIRRAVRQDRPRRRRDPPRQRRLSRPAHPLEPGPGSIRFRPVHLVYSWRRAERRVGVWRSW